MKKLFTLAISSLAVIGLVACGGSKKKDDPKPQPTPSEPAASTPAVTPSTQPSSPAATPSEEPVVGEPGFHAVGGWGEWEALEENKMAEVEADDVEGLAALLAEKDVAEIYAFDLTIGEESAGWETNALIDGAVEAVDGKFTVKVINSGWNEEEEVYTNDHWIPNPADTDCQHAEALTDNIFMPTYQKEPDENGFSWSDNPVMLVEEGTYTFVCVKYNAVSSEEVCGYGFALLGGPVA